MTDPKFDISILLPTRGRTESLERSVKSVFELAANPERVQIMFGFDNDDEVGITHFKEKLQPWLDERKIAYTAMSFQSVGYIRLNEYVNALAKASDSRWFVFWNDDAVMLTGAWDQEIMTYDGQFKLLAFHTHNDHPYSIFPIVPRVWLDLLGYLSPHPITDAWTSQQAYMLDIWQRIDVDVLHDRFDLTGNNNDETFKHRPQPEGNPQDPLDFHSVKQIELRHRDCAKLATYMKSIGLSTEFFENIFKGTQDPWEKLALNDVNKQMVQFSNPHLHFKNDTK